jgi:hypothetical protein
MYNISDEFVEYAILLLKGALLAALFFILFRKTTRVFTTHKYLQYGLIFLPSVIKILLTRYFALDFFPIVAGLFLYYAYTVFAKRYIGILTAETIEYKNLLGQAGLIHLKDVTKLEQKKNLLSIFREFKILDLSRRTGITFCDENLDEYEIDIFTKVFKDDSIFSKIIEHANKCGNLKIRQYTV